jgi:spermidine/putrescine transport system ATP-binding protein
VTPLVQFEQTADAVNVHSLSKTFGSGNALFSALSDVSVSIKQNEFFTLLGPSGCGKTTLLRLIAGFDYPSAGSILLYGKDVAHLPPFKRPINTVFQNYALFPHMTVAQNVGFGLRMLGWNKADIDQRVVDMLRLVRMENLKGRGTSQISGGQQQRVALARALAPRPKVLLLDEPLSALDYKLRKDMQVELKRMQAETGITFIFVTHDQEEALTMSDRIAVMNGGKILQVGSPREIYSAPASRFVAGFIGESNFLPCEVTGRNHKETQVRLADSSKPLLAHASDIETGSKATLAIRPEDAFIASKRGEGVFSALVEDVIFFGSGVHVRLKLGSGARFVIQTQDSGSSSLPQPADLIQVSFKAESARLLVN